MHAISSTPASPATRWLVAAAAVIQVLIPLLPSLGLGEPIGSRSDSVRTLITPAGWAFSIWGPLYAGAFLFAIYQFLPSKAGDPLLARLRLPAAGAFLGNGLWALYTQFFGLSAISAAIIVFTLLCLLRCYRVLAVQQDALTAGQRWLAMVPLCALAAWLTAATIVNIAASLRYHGIEAGDLAPLIAAGVIVVGGIIAAAALLAGGGNLPYALVFLWALAAIYAAGGQQQPAIALATGAAAILVVGATIAGFRRRRTRRQ
ncbi:hypothetical protein [Qipengyuania sp.]|uniref:hypothetical protein n=1 Tax=Qipengyuania sp. TaxID=2004515 RepID=UPI003736A71F